MQCEPVTSGAPHVKICHIKPTDGHKHAHKSFCMWVYII